MPDLRKIELFLIFIILALVSGIWPSPFFPVWYTCDGGCHILPNGLGECIAAFTCTNWYNLVLDLLFWVVVAYLISCFILKKEKKPEKKKRR